MCNKTCDALSSVWYGKFLTNTSWYDYLSSQQMFISTFYIPGPVVGARDAVVNSVIIEVTF